MSLSTSLPLPLDLFARLHEPFHCRGSLLQQRRHLLQLIIVVCVQPVEFGVSHEVEVDQILLDGYQRQLGELEEFLAPVPDGRFRLLAGGGSVPVFRPLIIFLVLVPEPHDLQQVLDPYPEVPVLVVPRLVARDHAPLQHLPVGPAGADAVRSLVHVEDCADAVARAVAVVPAHLQEGLASDSREIGVAGSSINT